MEKRGWVSSSTGKNLLTHSSQFHFPGQASPARDLGSEGLAWDRKTPGGWGLLILLTTTYYEFSLREPDICPIKNGYSRASLMEQWLRIRLPVQGTWVRSLVREDPTCRRATKPVCHNYWACVAQLLKPTHLEPVLCNKRSHGNEKPAHRNEE